MERTGAAREQEVIVILSGYLVGVGYGIGSSRLYVAYIWPSGVRRGR